MEAAYKHQLAVLLCNGPRAAVVACRDGARIEHYSPKRSWVYHTTPCSEPDGKITREISGSRAHLDIIHSHTTSTAHLRAS
jgi:hypothetical protein